MKKISIIIVTYNSENHIYKCLESIYKYNDIGSMLEVIIVDNNSSNVDNIFENINKLYQNKIILIKNKKNGGYGQGNNVGIRYSTAPIIMIMNPDVRMIFPILKKIIEHYTNNDVAMVGMKQMINLNKIGQSFLAIDTTHIIFNAIETAISKRLQIYNQNRMCFSGACFSIRKDVFEEIGLFDENIFMYGEEQDIYCRLRHQKKEMKLIYDKNLSYLHLMENREFTLIPIERGINSRVILCKKNKISVKKMLRNQIRLWKFLIIIEYFRHNNKRVENYKKVLSILYLRLYNEK